MRIIKESRRIPFYWYEHEFEYKDQHGCGFGFPCDQNGNLLPDLNKDALQNYQDCINGKRADIIDHGVIKHKRVDTEPAIGICDNCGKEVELFNEYMGSCQCECGEWYNLFGQHLLPPEEWGEDDFGEDY